MMPNISIANNKRWFTLMVAACLMMICICVVDFERSDKFLWILKQTSDGGQLGEKKKSGRVAMILASTGSDTGSMSHVVGSTGLSQLEETIQARQAYAQRHDYTFSYIDLRKFSTSLFNSSSVGTSWLKVPVMQHVLEMHPEAEWLWWLDHDA